MKHPLSSVLLSTCLIALPALLGAHGNSSEHDKTQQWRRTPTEIIWQGRYSNCDYGYFVDLPKGDLAHSPKPPQPNHGAIIDLARPNIDGELPLGLHRYVSFDSHYNVTGSSSLASIVEDEVRVMSEGKREFHVIAKGRARMAGLPAILLKVGYADSQDAVSALRMIAYRPPGAHGLGNIIYDVTLTSTRSAFERDRATFDAVVAGVHLAPLPLGACSND